MNLPISKLQIIWIFNLFLKISDKILKRFFVEIRFFLILLTRIFHIKPQYLRKNLIYMLFPEISKSITVKITKNEAFQIYTRRDFLSYHFFWYNLKNLDLTFLDIFKIFYKLVKNSRTVIDIGANTGVFSLIAGKINKTCKIYAFEPINIVYEQLINNIKLNRINNIIAENVAISNINDEIKISIPNNYYTLPTESSLNPTFSKNNVIRKKIISIKLDSYVKKMHISEIDLIKIDIEGEEPKAFEGMISIIKNQSPIIICEVLPNRTDKELQNIFSLYNYKYFLITDQGLKQKMRIKGHHKFFNYLFYKGNIDNLRKLIAPIKILS